METTGKVGGATAKHLFAYGKEVRAASRNRQTIIDTASRAFRERGVETVGVADLMKEAGFTHSGFYNHFPSKDALAAETVEATFHWAVGESADGQPGALQAGLVAGLDAMGSIGPLFAGLLTDVSRRDASARGGNKRFLTRRGKRRFNTGGSFRGGKATQPDGGKTGAG